MFRVTANMRDGFLYQKTGFDRDNLRWSPVDQLPFGVRVRPNEPISKLVEHYARKLGLRPKDLHLQVR